MELKTKEFQTEAQVNTTERSITQVITKTVEDRDTDIVYADGMKGDNYRKNPVVLWQHQRGELPVAKSLWEKLQGDEIIAKAQFSKTPFAEDLFLLVSERFINTVSIGFMPTKVDMVETGKIIEQWGMLLPEIKAHIREWELLEYSYVNIPANPSAEIVREMKSKEMQNLLNLKYTAIMDKTEIDAIIESIKPQIQELKDYVEVELTAIRENTDVKELQDTQLTLQEKLVEISGELTGLKDSAAKQVERQSLALAIKAAVAGEVSKMTGKVDHIVNS